MDVDYVQRINKPTSIFVTLNEKPIAIDRQLLDCDLFVPDNKSDYLFITTEINKNVVDSDIFSFYNKVFFDIGPRSNIIANNHKNIITLFILETKKNVKVFHLLVML